MGYRSNIALALSEKGKADVKNNLHSADVSEETRQEVERLFSNANQHLCDADTGSEAWYWSDVKWYLDFPDVKFIENILPEIDEEEYYFVRIGESFDDTDIQGAWLDNPFGIALCREIVLDC